MNGFQRKLALFEDGFARNPTLLYFQSCQEMLKDVTERRKHFSKYRKYLETLQQQFTTRFQNLVALQPRLALYLYARAFHRAPGSSANSTASRRAASAMRVTIASFLSNKTQRTSNFVLKASTRDPVSSSPGFCAFHGKHVWKHISGFFHNEIHQIKREKPSL